MKNVIKKTQKEIDAENKAVVEKTVGSKNYFYVSCDKCNVAFFKDDIILEDAALKGNKCPLIVIKGIFRRKSVCMNQMWGGDEKTFNRYYKLTPSTN